MRVILCAAVVSVSLVRGEHKTTEDDLASNNVVVTEFDDLITAWVHQIDLQFQFNMQLFHSHPNCIINNL